MSVAATILVPTFDHGPLLRWSLASALEQTVENIEVFVVGDGVPTVTRDIVREVMARDGRVRFFDNPKGPRHGEVHRHAALAEAQGDIVCYLSDDDLYLPGHVAAMLELLRAADFAHTLSVQVETDGTLATRVIDLARPEFRRFILEVGNRINLSFAGHTLRCYRSLPRGWRTTPPDTPTDWYMWRQILERPGCRAVSGFAPTVLNFRSKARIGMSPSERNRELAQWHASLRDPHRHAELTAELLGAMAREACSLQQEVFRSPFWFLRQTAKRRRSAARRALRQLRR